MCVDVLCTRTHVYIGTEDNLERKSELEHRSDHHSLSSLTAAATRASDINAQLPEQNYKAMVNEYCQKHYLSLPEYVTEFPDDSTGFVSVLTLCDKEYRSKPMAAKKKAEQNAAGKAALDLGLVTINERDYISGPNSSMYSSYSSGVSRSAPSSSRFTSLNSRLGGHTGLVSGGLAERGASGPESELLYMYML